MTDMVFFKHKVGDGVHYVNNNYQEFPNGHFQLGDTSEACILLNLETVLSRFNVEDTVLELWNEVYPGDPMTEEDWADLMYAAIDFTDEFSPKAPDDITAALDDVRRMACLELADLAAERLQAAGAYTG